MHGLTNLKDAFMECCFKISYWWGVAIVSEFPRILKEMFVELIKKKSTLSLSLSMII